MSRENVELVRALYDAYARGDAEAAFAHLHEDIEWSEPPDSPESGTLRGHEGVRRQITRWLGAWDEYRFEIDELIDVGDHVVASGHQYGRGRGSGVEVAEEHFHVWSLRRGKAVRMRMFRDRVQALEAVGRRE
jgi:ketosteroid isomerase-like protein